MVVTQFSLFMLLERIQKSSDQFEEEGGHIKGGGEEKRIEKTHAFP